MGRPVLCRVRLRCDFILDAETERPIDGNFLRAKFPTGDRVAGGLFETWFFIGEPG